MGSNRLEETIGSILEKTGGGLAAGLREAHSGLVEKLDGSLPQLEAEYDRIISEGEKEAEKIKKQLVGASDLEARNRQLLAVEERVDAVLSEAVQRIKSAERDDSYAELIKSMIAESAANLGTDEIVLHTSRQDMEAVRSAASEVQGARVSDEEISCLGGVIAESGDGAMAFDNTIDARMERLKPLIRKDIATIFGVR